MYSLESPRWGDSNENTQHTFMLKEDIPFMSPDLALLATLIGSNYPCLKLIFMVPKVFEPLKFDCTIEKDVISQVILPPILSINTHSQKQPRTAPLQFFEKDITKSNS